MKSVIVFVCLVLYAVSDGADYNVALRQPAKQSSNYSEGSKVFSADLAVDGNADTNFTNRHCAHNGDGAGGANWFVVDLGQQYYIKYVVLTNRNANDGREDYFFVGVSNTDPSIQAPVRGSYPLCGQYPSTVGPSERVSLYCSRVTPPGRYVIIQQPANGPGWLTICELEVYVGDSNIALNRRAYQSSVYVNSGTSWSADLAVDGVPTTDVYKHRCASVVDEKGGPNWLVVDMGQSFYISYVALTSRGDSNCCR